jgi:hypothetical protein
VAKLLKHFCNQFYPGMCARCAEPASSLTDSGLCVDVDVKILHSGAEIFHYDANVQFVNNKLRPPIEQHRRELAARYGEGWSRRLHVTLSLSDGAPARISAINASMRQFRPDCLHMWYCSVASLSSVFPFPCDSVTYFRFAGN